MARGTAQPQNVIFWGAGATRALGIRTTVDQEQFIRCITGICDPREPLKKRIAKALGTKAARQWHSALFDLMTILGDGNEAYDSIDAVSAEQLQAMRRNWGAAPVTRSFVGESSTFAWRTTGPL